VPRGRRPVPHHPTRGRRRARAPSRQPGRREAPPVLHGDVRVTLSALERRFLQHLREAALPLPRTNRPAGGRRVDCRWPEERLTVEVDSYRYHSSRHAWELDRRREREAHARGDEFRRYTWGDVFVGPGSMLAELREVLGRSRTKRQTGEPSSRASPS
jgi:very-short-patch-repair endonuclease